jgi:hypothetical protein
MSRVKRGLQLACLLGPLVLLAVPALARSETTFESSDTGYRIRNGSETCHGRSSSSIICQSRSGHYFIVGAHRYRRR